MNELEQVKTPDYFNWIGELKRRYRATQIKAAVAVNSALIEFYWHLGNDISERYPGRRRNAHFFDELSADLKIAIPESNGLSARNLRYVCAFYEFYADFACLQQVVANNELVVGAPRLDALLEIPWGHHVLILDKCKGDREKALFYVRKTIENGWSRSVLALEISQDLYSRQGKSVTNFALTMPKPDSDLAQQLTKDGCLQARISWAVAGLCRGVRPEAEHAAGQSGDRSARLSRQGRAAREVSPRQDRHAARRLGLRADARSPAGLQEPAAVSRRDRGRAREHGGKGIVNIFAV